MHGVSDMPALATATTTRPIEESSAPIGDGADWQAIEGERKQLDDLANEWSTAMREGGHRFDEPVADNALFLQLLKRHRSGLSPRSSLEKAAPLLVEAGIDWVDAYAGLSAYFIGRNYPVSGAGAFLPTLERDRVRPALVSLLAYGWIGPFLLGVATAGFSHTKSAYFVAALASVGWAGVIVFLDGALELRRPLEMRAAAEREAIALLRWRIGADMPSRAVAAGSPLHRAILLPVFAAIFVVCVALAGFPFYLAAVDASVAGLANHAAVGMWFRAGVFWSVFGGTVLSWEIGRRVIERFEAGPAGRQRIFRELYEDFLQERGRR
jgi:hypothetical protein